MITVLFDVVLFNVDIIFVAVMRIIVIIEMIFDDRVAHDENVRGIDDDVVVAWYYCVYMYWYWYYLRYFCSLMVIIIVLTLFYDDTLTIILVLLFNFSVKM